MIYFFKLFGPGSCIESIVEITLQHWFIFTFSISAIYYSHCLAQFLLWSLAGKMLDLAISALADSVRIFFLCFQTSLVPPTPFAFHCCLMPCIWFFFYFPWLNFYEIGFIREKPRCCLQKVWYKSISNNNNNKWGEVYISHSVFLSITTWRFWGLCGVSAIK